MEVKQTLKLKIIRNRKRRMDTYNLIVVTRIDVHDSLRFGLKIDKGLGLVGSCSTKGFMNGQAFRFRLPNNTGSRSGSGSGSGCDLVSVCIIQLYL